MTDKYEKRYMYKIWDIEAKKYKTFNNGRVTWETKGGAKSAIAHNWKRIRRSGDYSSKLSYTQNFEIVKFLCQPILEDPSTLTLRYFCPCIDLELNSKDD